MNTEDDKAVELAYQQASDGNVDALNFLRLFHAYAHRIDDFLDKKETDPHKLLSILADANILYSLPFYTAHAHQLWPVVAGITNAFADSIAWSKDREKWKSDWADILRFSGNEIVLAVALIEGGFELMRQISPVVKELSWWNHHDEDGKAD